MYRGSDVNSTYTIMAITSIEMIAAIGPPCNNLRLILQLDRSTFLDELVIVTSGQTGEELMTKVRAQWEKQTRRRCPQSICGVFLLQSVVVETAWLSPVCPISFSTQAVLTDVFQPADDPFQLREAAS